MKVTGFEAIKKKTDQMTKFAEEIDGELASVSFDPANPESIEAALQQISDAIDEKSKSYERNDWIQNLAAQLKEHARNNVLEKAAAARMDNQGK
ncbi:hypothetical protein [Roseovarius sp. D0-M9]|uniref:hypothetical protein n=1 Tax=Roseovarius sp. D0-M9 TaxID=3127117 RepID=UPI0030105AA5